MIVSKSKALNVRSISRKDCREFWISSRQGHQEGANIVKIVSRFLKLYNARTVSIRLFGSRANVVAAVEYLKKQQITCPPLAILHDGHENSLDIQVHALVCEKLRPLYFNNELAGCGFEDADARYLMLSLVPNEPQKNNYFQTQDIFLKAHNILAGFGSGFTDTVRTWIYADDILSWYDQLNKARNMFFEQYEVFDNLVPASTGIGAANLYKTALSMQVLAVIPKDGRLKIEKARSPLQCPALDYKSSFSRGVKLLASGHRRLYISGTASIDADGKTVFLNNTRLQLEKTMQVVEAVLQDANMSWDDTVSSLVYFKHRGDFALFDEYCTQHKINLPHIKIHADVCRDDLLFELELDAVSG